MQGERKGDPSSFQSLPVVAASSAHVSLFLLFSEWKFKPKPTKNTSWTCERELRSWMKVEQLFRRKERGLERVGGNWHKKREPREEEEGKKREKERGKILPNCPNLLRFERYGSCSLLLPPYSSNLEIWASAIWNFSIRSPTSRGKIGKTCHHKMSNIQTFNKNLQEFDSSIQARLCETRRMWVLLKVII